MKAELISFEKGLIDQEVDFNSRETPFWKLLPAAVFFTLFWISVTTWFYLIGGGSSATNYNFPFR